MRPLFGLCFLLSLLLVSCDAAAHSPTPTSSAAVSTPALTTPAPSIAIVTPATTPSPLRPSALVVPAPHATIPPTPTSPSGAIPDSTIVAWIELPTSAIREYRREFSEHRGADYENPLLPVYRRDVVAIDQRGTQQMIAHSVRAVLQRHNQPPLLITEPISGSFAITDPIGRTTIPIGIGKRFEIIPEFVLSPDESHIAFTALPKRCQGDACITRVMTADVHTGKPTTLLDHSQIDILLAWGADGLYFFDQYAGDEEGFGSLWLIDLPGSKPLPRELITDIHRGAIALNPTIGLIAYAGRLLTIHTGEIRWIDTHYAVDSSAISSDGTKLAYVYREDERLKNPTLIVYDIANGTSAIRQRGLFGDVSWSQQGDFLIFNCGTPVHNEIQMSRTLVFRADDGYLLDTIPDDLFDPLVNTYHQIVGLVYTNDQWSFKFHRVSTPQEQTVTIPLNILSQQPNNVPFYFNRPKIVYVP